MEAGAMGTRQLNDSERSGSGPSQRPLIDLWDPSAPAGRSDNADLSDALDIGSQLP